MEQTRRLLTAAPTSGVATYLEKELCADIEACSDRRALECVGEVLSFILAKGRLKKELAGFDLPSRSKQSVRTACNCAEKRVLALQAEERRKELAAAGSDARSKQQVEMVRDVREEDAEQEEARHRANVAAVDQLFSEAMKLKKK
ncbi:MAG: hypothetical protein SGPRY_005753 [Prymnesium sp.]